MQEYDRREEEKKLQALRKRQEQKRILHKQNDDMKDKYLTRLKEERIEGELVKQKVKEALEEERRAARERRLKKERNQQEVM